MPCDRCWAAPCREKVLLPTAGAFHDKNSHSESALHPRLGGETENIHFFFTGPFFPWKLYLFPVCGPTALLERPWYRESWSLFEIMKKTKKEMARHTKSRRNVRTRSDGKLCKGNSKTKHVGFGNLPWHSASRDTQRAGLLPVDKGKIIFPFLLQWKQEPFLIVLLTLKVSIQSNGLRYDNHIQIPLYCHITKWAFTNISRNEEKPILMYWNVN